MKNMDGPTQKEIDLLKKLEKVWRVVTLFCRRNKGAILMIIITIWILLFMYLLSYFYYNKESPTPTISEMANSMDECNENVIGQITLYNNFSTTSLKILSNTRLESESDGVVYRMSKSADVPGYTFFNGKKVAGQSEGVRICADKAEDEIQVGDLGIDEVFRIIGFKDDPKYELFYAKTSPADFDKCPEAYATAEESNKAFLNFLKEESEGNSEPSVRELRILLAKRYSFYFENLCAETIRKYPTKEEYINSMLEKVEIVDQDNQTKEVFFGDIDKKCPFYEPDGVSYRGCLSDFVDEQISAVNNQLDILINKLKATEIREDMSWMPYIIEDINEYKNIWDTFIYKKCTLESIATILGTAHSEQILLCVLGEIKDFSLKLTEIDKEYNYRN